MKKNMKYLRPKSAAEYLGIATSTLAKMRVEGRGPQFIKVGPRAVIYSVDRLDDWLSSRIYNNTSQYGLEVSQ